MGFARFVSCFLAIYKVPTLPSEELQRALFREKPHMNGLNRWIRIDVGVFRQIFPGLWQHQGCWRRNMPGPKMLRFPATGFSEDALRPHRPSRVKRPAILTILTLGEPHHVHVGCKKKEPNRDAGMDGDQERALKKEVHFCEGMFFLGQRSMLQDVSSFNIIDVFTLSNMSLLRHQICASHLSLFSHGGKQTNKGSLRTCQSIHLLSACQSALAEIIKEHKMFLKASGTIGSLEQQKYNWTEWTRKWLVDSKNKLILHRSEIIWEDSNPDVNHPNMNK